MNLHRITSDESLVELRRMAEASMGPARVFMHKLDYLRLGQFLLERGLPIRLSSSRKEMMYANTTFQVVADWEEGVATLAHYGE